MSDEVLRALERAWESAPDDQAALARVLAERRRRGLPVPWAQRRAQVFPPFRLEPRQNSGPHLRVVRPDGEWSIQFGPDVPAHRLVVVTLPSFIDRIPDEQRGLLEQVVARDGGVGVSANLSILALAEEVARVEGLRLVEATALARVTAVDVIRTLASARALEDLRLDLPASPVGDALAALRALPSLGAVWLGGRAASGAELAAVAALPVLAELSLSPVAPEAADDLRELDRAAALVSLRLAGGVGPAHLRVVSGLGARELCLRTCHQLRDEDLEHLAPLRLERLVLDECVRLGVAAAERARTRWPYARIEHRPAPYGLRDGRFDPDVHGCARCRTATWGSDPLRHGLVVSCGTCGMRFHYPCYCGECSEYGQQGADEVEV